VPDWGTQLLLRKERPDTLASENRGIPSFCKNIMLLINHHMRNEEGRIFTFKSIRVKESPM
jgi:hypothetical protein